MQVLRRSTFLARLVLAWFVLSLGVAVASPLVKPQDVQWVCSGSGMLKVLVSADDRRQWQRDQRHPGLPLCLSAPCCRCRCALSLHRFIPGLCPAGHPRCHPGCARRLHPCPRAAPDLA